MTEPDAKTESSPPPQQAAVPNTLADRLLDVLVTAVRDRRKPTGLVQRFFRSLRVLLVAVNIGYLVFLLAFLGALHWYGERTIVLWPFLYLPPWIWLAPLTVLGPITLVFRPILLLMQAACVLLVTVVYMDPEWNSWPETDGKALTVLTNNIGQKGGHAMTPYVEEQDPDIIAMQESGSKGGSYAKQYADRHTEYHGEFILISKFPITASGPVEETGEGGVPIPAAWFEIDFHGTPCVVYTVHFPSPRRELGHLRGRGLLKEVAKEVMHGFELREESVRWRLEQRLAATRALADLLKAEKRPAVVVGDFNVPDHGYTYNLFTSFLTDAFEERGRGLGYTFPGYTHNPIALFRPWLRLDFLFCDDSWRPVYCHTEPRRKSQHRSVVARFEFLGASDGE